MEFDGFHIIGVTVLFSFDFTYRKALSIMSHASIIAALDGLIMVATIYFRGMNEVQSPKDLESAVLSLSWFFGATLDPAIRAVLDSLTFFSVWYWVLLFVGITLTTKLSKVKAFLGNPNRIQRGNGDDFFPLYGGLSLRRTAPSITACFTFLRSLFHWVLGYHLPAD